MVGSFNQKVKSQNSTLGSRALIKKDAGKRRWQRPEFLSPLPLLHTAPIVASQRQKLLIITLPHSAPAVNFDEAKPKCPTPSVIHPG